MNDKALSYDADAQCGNCGHSFAAHSNLENRYCRWEDEASSRCFCPRFRALNRAEAGATINVPSLTPEDYAEAVRVAREIVGELHNWATGTPFSAPPRTTNEHLLSRALLEVHGGHSR